MPRSFLYYAIFYTIALGLLALPSYGQRMTETDLQLSHRYKINKTSELIVLDGELNEAAWQSDNFISDFWVSYPVDNVKADQARETRVWMTYDDKNLYIGAVCFGDGPVLVQSLKRDGSEFWEGDAFSVVLDPVNERSNGYNFAVNPKGVQYESLISGQTGRRGGGSSGFNTAWNNKWYAEAKILPDRWTVEMVIPFKTLRFGTGQEWGLNVLRGVKSKNTYHSWSPVPVEFYGVDLGYTGVLIFDEPLEKVKSNISLIPYLLGSTYKDLENDEAGENNFQLGGDAKIAITTNLNLDVTLNPDFSQVEVDQQVTNLTTVNLRFPEQRTFFLENSDIYSEFGIPPMRPFFSRRIGLDEDGNAVPILYGARLSGNLHQNMRIGVMNLQTKDKTDVPGQNYTSVALHQRVLDRSNIKAYFHNRQGMVDGELSNQDYNRTMGLEFEYRSLSGRMRAFGGYGLSFSDGLSTDNFFYNGAIGYDSRNFSLYSNLAGVGNNYRADMGFIPRINHYDAQRDTTLIIGFHHSFTRLAYTFYPENQPNVISHRIGIQNVLDVTKDGFELIENKVELEYDLTLANTSTLQVVGTYADIGLLFPFAFSEGDPLPAGRYDFNYIGAKYMSDNRKAISVTAGFEYGGFYNGTRRQLSFGLKYRQTPWGNFGINLTTNQLDFPDPYLDETLVLIGPRIEFNFTRDLFWTTFIQYNTQEDNLNINSRFQWRFSPLSDMFIVYTDNYSVDIWGPKNRAIVLKINYWINL